MDQLIGTLAAAVGVFAGTNIDDVIVLTVLFLTFRTSGRPRPWQIVLGQYTGIGVLVAASAIAALGLTIVPDQWVGLLGLVPIALGVRSLVHAIRARNDGEDPSPVVASGLFSVAAVTIANGADNISVYTPMFRALGVVDSLITAAVFVVLVGVWCAAGARLAGHQRIIDVVKRCGHWLVPAIFIAIGTIIIVESGVIGALSRLA